MAQDIKHMAIMFWGLKTVVKLRQNSRLSLSDSKAQLSFRMAGLDIGVLLLPHNERGCLLWSWPRSGVAWIGSWFH